MSDQLELITSSLDDPFFDTKKMIEAVHEGLRVQAQKICDDWWDVKFRMEADTFRPKKKSILGTRVRVKEGNFYCEWYFNDFATENSAKKVYSKAIRFLKTGHSVNLRTLRSKMEDWEVSHTMYAEREYQKIRALAADLVIAKKNISKVSEKYMEFYRYKASKL